MPDQEQNYIFGELEKQRDNAEHRAEYYAETLRRIKSEIDQSRYMDLRALPANTIAPIRGNLETTQNTYPFHV